MADYEHGPVYRELWRNRGASMCDLFYWDPRRKRYGCLSKEAKKVLHDAHEQLTGMVCGVNDYWLAEVMSEAIEAAEELML